MRLYELTYLLSSRLTEEEFKSFSEKISSFVKENEGILAEDSQTKEKSVKGKLGSPIKKEGQAYLNSLSFHFDPQKIEKLKTKLNSENRVLRYFILTKKLPKKTKIFRPSLLVPKIKKKVEPLSSKIDLEEIEKKLEEILGE